MVMLKLPHLVDITSRAVVSSSADLCAYMSESAFQRIRSEFKVSLTKNLKNIQDLNLNNFIFINLKNFEEL